MTIHKQRVLKVKIEISTNIDKNYEKNIYEIKTLCKKLLSSLKMENVFKLNSKRQKVKMIMQNKLEN